MHFVALCEEYSITQAFTRIKRPQTNGKAERFIRTLIEMWHKKEQFTSRIERKQSLKRFLNWYNTVKSHKTLD
jgi:transposase InsO family protein